MVGSKVEHAGIIRHGAKMLHVMSAATVPKITVVVRKAYGAGYYVMCGRAYEPDLIVSWPTGEISVMGAEGMVGIAAQEALRRRRAAARGEEEHRRHDPEEHRHLQGRRLGPRRRRHRPARHAPRRSRGASSSPSTSTSSGPRRSAASSRSDRAGLHVTASRARRRAMGRAVQYASLVPAPHIRPFGRAEPSPHVGAQPRGSAAAGRHPRIASASATRLCHR